MKYEQVIRAVCGQPWMMEPARAQQMLAFLELKAAGGAVDEATVRELAEATAERRAATDAARAQAGEAIAVLPMVGIMSQRGSMMDDMSGPGGVSTQQFSRAFRQAMEDPQVGKVIIDVDSPGGNVYGVDELASEIFAARGRKDVIAVANSLMASAAYYAMSGAAEIVVTPGGEVGSIGVLALHDDMSAMLEMRGIKPTLVTAGKFKAEFSPDFPLSDEARAHLQEDVDRYYGMFLRAVARGRGVSVAAVRGGFGEGRVVGAQEAVKLGMADRVATLEETIGRYAGGGKVGARKQAGGSMTAMAAVLEEPNTDLVLPDPESPIPGVLEVAVDEGAAQAADLRALDLAVLP